MTRMQGVLGVVGLALMLTGAPRPADAGPLLLANETALENLVGWGNLNFALLFEKTDTVNTAEAFHAAADGKGPTFTLMQVTYGNDEKAIIGGYNPQSWESIIDPAASNPYYRLTLLDSDRTGFIFNLTTGVLQTQRPASDALDFPPNWDHGSYQTYNKFDYGPTFGGGFDLMVAGSGLLSEGYARQFAYGVGDPCGNRINGENILGFYAGPCLDATTRFTVDALEVYTFSLSDVETGAPVPEPATLALFGTGLAAIVVRRWRRRSA